MTDSPASCRRIALLTLWLALGLLAGCGTDPAPVADPLPIGDATYTHTPSGFVFPAAVDHFRRVGISRQDPQGQSVNITYTLDNPAYPLTALVHVYPAHVGSGAFSVFEEPVGMTSKRSEPEVAALQGELTRLHPALRVVAHEDAFLVQAGVEQSGRELIVTFDDAIAGRTEPMVVDAYAFCCRAPNHAVIYRFQYPQADAATAAPVVAMFMRDLPGAPQ